MAKISDKLLDAAQRHTAKLQLQLSWLRAEHAAVPDTYRQRKEAELRKFLQKANKKLLAPAFLACDKEQYAACQMAEQLAKYDIKAALSYRALNHATAKAIFQAVHNGLDWTPALETMEPKWDRLQAKRSAHIQKLEAKKQSFLSRHTATDPAPYDALKARLTEEYQALSDRLDAQYAQAATREQQAIQEKIDRISQKIDAARAKHPSQYQLDEDVVLSIRGLKMYFGGLKAVDDLTFDVKKGEIFGLIGPNGAGKTTVFNCITQFYKPTDGQLLFRTRDDGVIRLTDYPVHDIVSKGILRTFQNLEVVKEVSVLDNMLIAATRQYTSSLVTQMLHLPKLGREERMIRAKADRVLKYMGLSAYRDRLCWGLPYGVLKRVEIARALMCDPQLIILDEPAAGLNESETRDLAELIRRIRTDFDCTVLLVEHDMSLVMNVCDHICAISFGRKLACGTADQIKASKEVQEAYLGTEGT